MKRMLSYAAGIAAALLLASASGSLAATALGPHDNASGNPCKVCHDTASGNPTLRGWAGAVGDPGTLWAKNVSVLCYYCHDNTGGGMGANDMSANAYADSSHGFLIAIAPELPDGVADGSVVASGLPYVTTGELECTSCHNVHVSTIRPFNQRSGFQDLCNTCHAGRVNNGSPWSQAIAGGRNYSTHPTQIAFDEAANMADANLLAAPAAALDASIGAVPGPGNYNLGGHWNSADGTSTGGTMDCQTCHAVHGPGNGNPGVNAYLAIDNDTNAAVSGSLLCEGCHFGGGAGEQVGDQVLQAGLGADEWSDHPIDLLINRTFYPTGAEIPNGTSVSADWTAAGTPNADAGAQPFLSDATPGPACSSCHDTHGGMENTSLLRGPSVDLTGAVTWTFSYDEWCFVCHLASEILPVNHHSVLNNAAPGITDTNGNAPTDQTGAAFTSQLSCGDCHSFDSTTDMTAHNGFWAWDNTGNSVANTTPAIGNSNFCIACHVPTDPLAYNGGLKTGQVLTSPFDTPAGHGLRRGTGAGSSHQVESAADGIGSTPYVGWTGGPDWTAWGAEAATAVNPGRNSENAGGVIVCESCHNILYNGVAAETGLTNGWEANLLLGIYEDDGQGTGGDSTYLAAHDYYVDTALGNGNTGVDYCRACHQRAADTFVHNPAAHTMDSTYTYDGPQPNGDPNGYNPYGRTTNTVMTTPTDSTGASCPEVSTADNSDGSLAASTLAAPGYFSYPADNQVNCDSCHRPHSADPQSYDSGDNRYLILEWSDVATNTNWGSAPCLECHNTNEQCN